LFLEGRVLGHDGNLALHGKDGHIAWSTRTGGHPGSMLTVHDDGTLTLHTPDGVPTWSNRTITPPIAPRR
jgi:hypothetical protein